jgi:hypothetical protein
MNRIFPVAVCLLVGGALLVGVSASLPSGSAAAQSPTQTATLTEAQADQAAVLKSQYHQLKAELYGLNAVFDKAAGYRNTYVAFLTSEQFHGRNTKTLEDSLSNFDSYIHLAREAQQNGIIALDETKGFDSSGNVVDIALVSGEIHSALGFDSTAHFYLNLAVFELHSALNLYHQVSGVEVPDIPKLRLPPFTFSTPTPAATSVSPTTTPSPTTPTAAAPTATPAATSVPSPTATP